MSAAAPLVREESPLLRIARSQGSCVYDARGRRYVDFLMGWCVGNLGWGNAVLERAARDYDGPDYVYPGFEFPPWQELARLLLSIAPRPLSRCFRATGGSEAVDLALQAAMIHTGRRRFLSIEGAYHGNTLAALSVGASSHRDKRPNLLPHCGKVAPPLDERALARIERSLAKRDVAAFIMEPVPMSLGVLIPAHGFHQELQRLCRRHGTLLIMDEVATGFGRTGALFACEHFGLEPDMVTLAKAITDGVGGLGALLATERVARSMQKHGAYYSTYGWHPRSTVVAIATLRYILRHRRRLFASLSKASQYFAMRLAAMRFRREAKVRVLGLAIAIDFEDAKYASRLAKRCLREGLLVSTEGGTLMLIPALDIDHATAAEGLDILERCA